MERKKIREDLVKQLSLDTVLRETETISEDFAWRLSGTKIAEDAAKYYVDYMRKNGVDAKLLTTKGYLNVPEPADLKVVSPVAEEIRCAACAQCGSTPPEGITAEVVHVGPGGVNDYIGKDVKGKIVLAELSYAPPRPEKTRIAIANGAAGMLLMNWGSDESEYLGYGTVKSPWGNPTPETISLMDNTPPIVMITRKDGVHLRKIIESGEKLTVTLRTHAEREWMDIFLPYAEIKAPNGDGDFVLMTGHMDAWSYGASDNASANALCMEMAKVLQANRHLLKRDVRFAFWQGHENGIMEGSTWFIEKFWDDLDEHCVAVFNFDSYGLWKASVWHNEVAAELKPWIVGLDDVIIDEGVGRDYVRTSRIGDMSFFGIGIPASFTWMFHTKEEIAGWCNATLGEYYHSDADNMDFMDKDVLAKCMKYGPSYVFDLALTPVLPMDFVPVADEILNRVNDLTDIIKGRPDAIDLLEMDKVKEIVLEFRDKAAQLETLRQKAVENHEAYDVAALNHALKQISRAILPMTCTVTGRYEQDTYGLSALHYVIPCSESIRTLVSYPENSHDYYVWSTRAKRDRNKITDAVRHATTIINQTLK